jgi:hypothetical protein
VVDVAPQDFFALVRFEPLFRCWDIGRLDNRLRGTCPNEQHGDYKQAHWLKLILIPGVVRGPGRLTLLAWVG